jgi:hypothetical protein
MAYQPYPKYKDSGVPWLGKIPEGWHVTRLDVAAIIRQSNVDKKSNETEINVKLCNYVDVYRNKYISSNIKFMNATTTSNEIKKFKLLNDDVIITKDSESADDIGIAAIIQEAAKANSIENFRYIFEKMLTGLLVERMEGNEEIFAKVMNDDAFRKTATDHLVKAVYDAIHSNQCEDKK